PDKKDPPAKVKGFLPPYFSKIGLSDEQRQTIYKIQAKYKEDAKKLQEAEKQDIDKVLTPEQKKKLIEVITGSKDEPKKDSK
ncbi:MAG: hypothetical protein K8T89_23640, partial [Planctomycetes bacterium]|nr:hypothetical protein [Planctomycetota bacterium]